MDSISVAELAEVTPGNIPLTLRLSQCISDSTKGLSEQDEDAMNRRQMPTGLGVSWHMPSFHRSIRHEDKAEFEECVRQDDGKPIKK